MDNKTNRQNYCPKNYGNIKARLIHRSTAQNQSGNEGMDINSNSKTPKPLFVSGLYSAPHENSSNTSVPKTTSLQPICSSYLNKISSGSSKSFIVCKGKNLVVVKGSVDNLSTNQKHQKSITFKTFDANHQHIKNRQQIVKDNQQVIDKQLNAHLTDVIDTTQKPDFGIKNRANFCHNNSLCQFFPFKFPNKHQPPTGSIKLISPYSVEKIQTRQSKTAENSVSNERSEQEISTISDYERSNSPERKRVRRSLANEIIIQKPPTSTDNIQYAKTSCDHRDIQNQISSPPESYHQRQCQIYTFLPIKNESGEECFSENENWSTSDTHQQASLQIQNQSLEPQNSEQLISTEQLVSNELLTVKELFNNRLKTDNKVFVAAPVPLTINKVQVGKNITVNGVEYLVLNLIMEGINEVIYRVQNLSNFELRDIKYVHLLGMNKEETESCIEEIKILFKLQGPSIVKMYDFEINKHSMYLVLEMGDTELSRLLEPIISKKALPLTMILYYWTEMLSIVKHIHDNDVVHSDLKPASFLSVNGSLKLKDFGVASIVNSFMTYVIKNKMCGTLHYMSPESLRDIRESSNQPSKFKISYKSDVWSLGCILYLLIYGRTPFQHLWQQSVHKYAITPDAKIHFPEPINSDPIPPMLIDVIKECLQHNPEARPSVEQLLQIHFTPIEHHRNVLDIRPTTVMKIKNSLNDEEWREFIEMIEKRKNP